MNYWGGAQDGTWYGPAKGISLLIDGDNLKSGKQTASLLIDRLTAQVGNWVPNLKI